MYLDTLTIAGRRVTLKELEREPVRDKQACALFEHLRKSMR